MARSIATTPCSNDTFLTPLIGTIVETRIRPDFVVRVRRSVDQLVSDPERRSTAEFGIRYWPVERFPYVVFYDLTELEVLVIGAMHTSQESQNGSPVEDDSANNACTGAAIRSWKMVVVSRRGPVRGSFADRWISHWQTFAHFEGSRKR